LALFWNHGIPCFGWGPISGLKECRFGRGRNRACSGKGSKWAIYRLESGSFIGVSGWAMDLGSGGVKNKASRRSWKRALSVLGDGFAKSCLGGTYFRGVFGGGELGCFRFRWSGLISYLRVGTRK